MAAQKKLMTIYGERSLFRLELNYTTEECRRVLHDD